MKIYYQGNPGSYMGIASKEIAKNLSVEIEEIIGVPSFTEVWEQISQDCIGVLAIENSYMGSIHQNLYNFLDYDYKIIGEYYLEIKHCICSLETAFKNVKEVYSQAPALEQCKKYLEQYNLKPHYFSDTALSAKHIQEQNLKSVAAICSEDAAKLYGLNILETDIADQKGNTTRFVAIVPKNISVFSKHKSNKTSIIFKTKNVPASLYKSLGAFATEHINLSKLESLPAYGDKFSYNFWIDFDANLEEESVKRALKELHFFAKELTILGNY